MLIQGSREDMAHAFIERQPKKKTIRATMKDQKDDERPEISLHAVAERMSRIRRTSAALLPDQKQDLVAGIDQRLDRLGQHRGRGNSGGDEFREPESKVARERDNDHQCRAFGHDAPSG
jgi:hypothetical protein